MVAMMKAERAEMSLSSILERVARSVGGCEGVDGNIVLKLSESDFGRKIVSPRSLPTSVRVRSKLSGARSERKGGKREGGGVMLSSMADRDDNGWHRGN